MRVPTSALLLTVTLVTATSTLVSAGPAVHLTEQHYRSNAQHSGKLVFPSVGEAKRPSTNEPCATHCATGRLGASERWSILLLHDGAKQLRRSLASAHLATAVFVNAERRVRVRSPPCAAALTQLRACVAQERLERETVHIERLDAASGGAVVVTDVPATPRVVVSHGDSVPIAHDSDIE